MPKAESPQWPELEIKISSTPVGREEELGMIRERIELIQRGEKVPKTILTWTGIPGMGKTTFSEMVESLCTQRAVNCFRLDPAAPESWGLPFPEEQTQPTVFIVNSHPGNHPLRDQMQHRLAPLILSKQSLLVITDQTKWHWRYDLGLRDFDLKLPPFSEEETRQQIGSVAERVYPLTHGHPLANTILAQLLLKHPRPFTDRELIDIQMDLIINQHILSLAPEPLRPALPILAVTRCYDANLFGQLLRKYVPDYEEITGHQSLTLIGKLNQSGLAGWNKDFKAFQVDPTLSHILSLHLQTTQPDLYAQIHQKVLSLNESWIPRDDLADTRHLSIAEALYHQACLGLHQGQNPEQVADQLQEELRVYLMFVA